MSKGILTKQDIRNANLRWMSLVMISYCYEYQFGQGFANALYPALKKIHTDPKDLQEAMINEWQYFNTQPYMVQIILGVVLAMEEELGIEGKGVIQDFKTGVMGPLAGIGDTLFWSVIPTIWASIAAPMAIEGNPVGIILWTVFQVFLLAFRMKFTEYGYDLGMKLITSLRSTLQTLTDACSVLGLTVVGALIPSVVSVQIPYVINFATGTSMSIQEQLDKIIPYSIPILLTYICYRLLGNRKVTITQLVFVVLGISIVGAALGILG